MRVRGTLWPNAFALYYFSQKSKNENNRNSAMEIATTLFDHKGGNFNHIHAWNYLVYVIGIVRQDYLWVFIHSFQE